MRRPRWIDAALVSHVLNWDTAFIALTVPVAVWASLPVLTAIALPLAMLWFVSTLVR
jgi:uncharacterized membrane protein